MIDQLVEQGIRLRRNTNGDVVLLRHENRRDQIRHRLSNAGACLDYEILGSFEGRTNFLSHRELLFTGIEINIKLSHNPRRRKCLSNILRSRIFHRLNHLRIDTRSPLIRGHAFMAEFLKGTPLLCSIAPPVREARCISPRPAASRTPPLARFETARTSLQRRHPRGALTSALQKPSPNR